MEAILKQEIGKYRVSVYYDESPECPVQEWSLLGTYLWANECYLSPHCNFNALFADNSHTVEEALAELVATYTDIDEETAACMDVDALCNELDYCEEIALCRWSSRGCCQGDYVEGFAFCTRAHYAEYTGEDTRPGWRADAIDRMKDEARIIGRWIWGDVYGYILEEKVPFTKVYDDLARPATKCEEWEQIDSCWGYYMEPEELINEALENNGLAPRSAA